MVTAAHQDVINAQVGAAAPASGSVVPVFPADITITKVSDGTPVVIRVASVDFKSKGTHTPAHVWWPGRLRMPGISSSALRSSRPIGSGAINVGPSMEIINHADRDDGTGSYFKGLLDQYLRSGDYDWIGGTAQLYVGDPLDDPAAWSRLPKVTINSLQWDSKSIKLGIRAGVMDLTLESTTRFYKGFGSALSFASASSQYGTGGQLAGIAATQGFAFGLRVKTSTTGAVMPLINNKTALNDSTAGTALWFTVADALRLRIADGTNTVSVDTATGGAGQDGAYHDVQGVLTRSATNADFPTADTLYLLFDGGTPVSVSASAVGAIVGSAASQFLATTAGSSVFHNGEIDHLGIFPGKLPTLDDLRAWREGPYPRDIPGAMPYEMDSGSGNQADMDMGVLLNAERAAAHYHTIAAGGVGFGNVLNVNASASFTLGKWCITTTGGSAMALVGKKASMLASAPGYVIRLDSGTVTLTIADGTDQVSATVAGTVHDGAPVCLLGQRRISDGFIRAGFMRWGDTAPTWGTWTDASLVGDTTDAGANFKTGELSGGTQTWVGSVSSARLFSRVLTDQEVVDYYSWNADHGDIGIRDAWEYNEQTGSTINGLFNNGTSSSSTWVLSHFTLVNAPTWVQTNEGGAELSGISKVDVFGEAHSVPCRLVDPVGHTSGQKTWAFGSGTYPYQALVKVYEGQVELATTAVDLTANTFRVAGDPRGELTAHVRGARFFTGTTYSNNLGQIAKFLIETEWGAATVDTATLNNFVATHRGPAGVVIGRNRGETRAAVLEHLFAGRAWWADTLAGDAVRFLTLRDPKTQTANRTIAAGAFADDGVKTGADPAPVTKSVTVAYQRHWAVVPPLDISTPADRRERGREWRPYKVTSQSVTLGHPSAEDWPTGGALGLPYVRLTEASREATALQALFSVPRQVLAVDLVRDAYKDWVGDVVELPTTGRWGWLGKMLIVGATISNEGRSVRLLLWG